MTAFLRLWIRRLWPYIALLMLIGAGVDAVRRVIDRRALALAHERTAVATAVAARADTVFQVDTVERRVAVTAYRALRDTVRSRLTDTLVARALEAADTAIARSDTSLAKAGRALEAHRTFEGALRTELAIAERRRAPRFTVSSQIGVDVDAQTPVTGLELQVRVTDRWSIVGRLDKRWAPGEGSRRQLLLRYSAGR